MYVYVKSEPGLWITGHYKPDGEWEPEKDCESKEEAAERVAWLNGGGSQKERADHLHAALLRMLRLHDSM
ncbi:MAG: hypothetical protein ACLFWM_12110, partial [Actinomycetota bacterium]